jgi:hypothetical protein
VDRDGNKSGRKGDQNSGSHFHLWHSCFVGRGRGSGQAAAPRSEVELGNKFAAKREVEFALGVFDAFADGRALPFEVQFAVETDWAGREEPVK